MALNEEAVMSLLPDGGPKYFETNMEQLIVEPWNMASAILFIFLTVYWLFRLRGTFKTHPFLTYSTLILGIGAVGGTIYHGFRIAAFFMYMDWMPILILCIAASIYFFIRLFNSYKTAFGALAVFVLLQFAVLYSFDPPYATNFSYALLAVYILMPTFLLLKRNGYQHWQYLVLSLLCFSVALTCRVVDPWGWLPMGTHFLWHTFGAAATHFIFRFVYEVSKMPQEQMVKAS